MEIDIFTICDYADSQNDGKLFLAGSFDVIYSPTFPTVHARLFIAARLRFSTKENKENAFEMSLLDPSKKIIMKANGDFQIRDTDPEIDTSTVNLVIALNNVRLEAPGNYSVQFYLNNQLQRTIPLNVRQRARTKATPV